MKNQDKMKIAWGSHYVPGGRKGVLLVHSLGGSPIELRFLAHALGKDGYTVYCPTLPGLAGGTDITGLSSWTDWYAALETAHDEISKQCDTILVGGISAGTMLALRLAAMRPDGVQGLLLFSPTLWANGWAIPWYFSLFRLVKQKWAARLFHFKAREPHGIKDDRLRSFIVDALQGDSDAIEDFFGRGGGLVLEFRKLVRNVKPLLNKVKQHTLMFHPRHDDQSDLKNAMTIQRRLAGLVELHVLDDCYHMVTLDRQRSIVVERTTEFAARLTKRFEDTQTISSAGEGNLKEQGSSKT
jgi:carboxylesterase